MEQQLCLYPESVYSHKPPRSNYAREFKVIALRETTAIMPGDAVERIVEYWHKSIPTAPWFDPAKECLASILLNSRRKIIGHHLVSTGSLDTIFAHAREIFRAAIVAASATIVLVHNHPAGDPTPSEADIKFTREIIRSGKILRLEVCDHVIIGNKIINPRGFTSLRELGYFYS